MNTHNEHTGEPAPEDEEALEQAWLTLWGGRDPAVFMTHRETFDAGVMWERARSTSDDRLRYALTWCLAYIDAVAGRASDETYDRLAEYGKLAALQPERTGE